MILHNIYYQCHDTLLFIELNRVAMTLKLDFYKAGLCLTNHSILYINKQSTKSLGYC